MKHNRIAYELGCGHTASIVRHTTRGETADILPESSVFAIKMLAQNPSSGVSSRERRDSRRDASGMILQELQIFCHQELSEHPNIVKLWFPGWTNKNPLPVLGLEVADFGSLDYILRAPGYGLSKMQKMNIIIDIGLGLHALHANGFAHGDLKPENIVILKHPDASRQIVAKLTDFGGAADISRGEVPAHYTPLWCTPEVLLEESDIDWFLSDVYSYGLVAASMMARPDKFITNTRRHCSVLASFVSTAGDESDEPGSLLKLKSLTADHEDGAANAALSSMPQQSRDSIGPLVRATVNPHVWERIGMNGLVEEHLRTLSKARRRDISCEIASEPTKSGFTRTDEGLFNVLSEEFVSRGFRFQQQVLQELLAFAGNDPALFDVADFEDLPADVDPNIPLEEFACHFDHRLGQFLSFVDDSNMQTSCMMAKASACFQISLCYLTKIKTHLDIDKGLSWLRAAALGRCELALTFGTTLHRAFSDKPVSLGPYRFFLCLCGFFRHLPSLDMLATEWPSHYAVLIRLIRSGRFAQLGLDNRIFHTGFSKRGFPNPSICRTGSNEMLDALRSYDLPRLYELFEKSAKDRGPADERNISLYTLSLLRDDDAAPLARILVDHGAKLDEDGQVSDEGPVIPLLIAMRDGQTKLAHALIDLHVEYGIPLKNFVRIVWLGVMNRNADIVSRLLRLQRQDTQLCDTAPSIGSPGLEIDDLDPTLLLVVCVLSTHHSEVEKLEILARYGLSYDTAHLATIRLLLDEGADPTSIPWDTGSDPTASAKKHCSPLYSSLNHDDSTALKAFIEHFRSHEQDPVLRLRDLQCSKGLLAALGEKPTALQVCITSLGRKCFDFLSQTFPELIQERSSTGSTSLHTAAMVRACQPDITQALLDKGVDVLAETRDGTTALCRALLHRNLRVAGMIHEHCTLEQKDMLLRRHPDTGMSVFSRLVEAWSFPIFHPDLLKSLQWVVERGGAHFFTQKRVAKGFEGELPVWNELLARTRGSSRRKELQDLRLANFLFDLFPNRLEDVAPDGRCVLLVATMYGHVGVVKSLLDRGVNVNQEWGQTSVCPSFVGQTSLDIAITRSSDKEVPSNISKGGFQEIRRWERDMESIIDFLVRYKANSGSGASGVQAIKAAARKVGMSRCVSVITWPPAEEPSPYDTAVGSWPQGLPRDETSVPMRDPMSDAVMRYFPPYLKPSDFEPE